MPVGQRDQLFAAISTDPDHHQQAQLALFQPHGDMMSSAHRSIQSTPDRPRAAKARCSAFHCSVIFVNIDADSPAVEPRNCPSVAVKFPR